MATKTKRKSIWIRRSVQIFFLLLIALIAVNHSLRERGGGIPLLSSASLHAVCPFGGVVSVYQFIASGTLVRKVHESSFVLMFIVFALALGLGAVFCGWVCPFGTVQEFFGKLGKKTFGKKYNAFIPSKADKVLRFLRYGVLVWVIYMTINSGKLIFQAVDPYYALFNFWTGEVAITGFIALFAIIIGALFVERPWCKYLCPYGALLGVFNTFRIVKLKRDSDKCISCNKCEKVCPMNINICDKQTIRNHQCITCLECTSERACPAEDSLGMKL